MSAKSRPMICPRCGTKMNHHADHRGAAHLFCVWRGCRPARSLDDPPSIDTRYEPPRSAPVFLIRGAEPGGEERLLRVDPIDEDPEGEHDRDDADGAPEDERPAEEADHRAEIA